MKYYRFNTFQIGDIQAFKKMLADAIESKKLSDQNNRICAKSFSFNDQFYLSNAKNIDFIDS